MTARENRTAAFETLGEEVTRLIRDGLRVPFHDAHQLFQAIDVQYMHGGLPHEARNRLNHDLFAVVRAMGFLPEVPMQQFDSAHGTPRDIGVNLSGPLDLSLECHLSEAGLLKVHDVTVSPGGGQSGFVRTFSHAKRPVGLVPLVGRQDFVSDYYLSLISSPFVLISPLRYPFDQRINIQLVVNGQSAPFMVGWGETVGREVFDEMIAALRELFCAGGQPRWVSLTAGGGMMYDDTLAPYRRIVECAHECGAEALIDFKWTSTETELRSVLEVERLTPHDIIKPNRRELHIIARLFGLLPAESGDAATRDELKRIAGTLRKRFNLRGVLVSLDQDGAFYVDSERVFDEPGIVVDVRNDLGAGDAAKAAFLMSLIDGASPHEALRAANLHGAATVLLPGTEVATPADVAQLARRPGLS